MSKLVINMSKAVRGSTRPHKYIRRVRKMVGGELRWTYYYADKKQKARGRHRAKEDDEHKLMQRFAHDQGLAPTKKLEDLNAGYITEKLGWEKPLKITGNVGKFHDPVAALPERRDPHGQPMSPLRALDLALDRVPPSVKGRLDGILRQVKLVDDASMTARMRSTPELVATSTATSITLAVDRLSPWNSEHNMNGGMPMPEAFMREYGARLYASGLSKDEISDFTRFMAVTGFSERGVTALAEEGNANRFAESFAAAMLYPQQLAETAPATYEWFRGWMADNALPPLITATERRRVIGKEIKAAGLKGNQQKMRELRIESDRLLGILDRPADDPTLQWWVKPETELQTQLRQDPGTNWNSADKSAKKRKDDRFYEISHGGRTIFIRLPKGAKPGQRNGVAIADLREVWSEEGKALDNESAWWHLFQDEWGDDHPENEGMLGFEIGKKAGTDHTKARNRNALFKKLWTAKGTSTPAEITEDDFRARSGTLVMDRWEEPGKNLLKKMKTTRPGSPAHAKLVEAYRAHQPNIHYSQINVDQMLIDHGLYPQSDLGRFVNLPTLNPDGTPRLTKKIYSQPMPDGSTATIELLPGDPTDPTASGKWYIASPVWRSLLTPHGEDVPSPERMRRLAAQATEAGQGRPPRPRRAWVTVQADARGGDVPHYFHLQTEWDGRGLPKILGAEWKRRLGVDEPRIGDLVVGEGTNARVKAGKIRLQKKPRRARGKAALPKKGDRVILTVRPGDRGISFDKEVNAPFVLDRILPAKAAGIIPSEPGWDRMPESVSEDLQPPNVFPGPHETYEDALIREVAAVGQGEGAHQLTAEEARLRLRGLLPDWYIGDPAQRSWLKRVFRPARREWVATKRDLIARAVPERYVFVGEAGKQRVGGKRVIRRGARAVLDDLNPPETVRPPRPLPDAPLIYLHEKVDDVDGTLQDQKLRLLLPADGSVTGSMLENVPGVHVVRHPLSAGELAGAVDYIDLDIAGFALVRDQLGGASMTGAAVAAVNTRIGWLQDLADEQTDQTHKIALNDIDPLIMAARGVELNAILPNGADFVLAEHQKAGFQKVIDNDGRALIAHTMGTGKTVTSIALIKFLQSLKDVNDKTQPHPLAPKRVLITAPKSVVEQWRGEFSLFDGGALVVGAGKSDIPYDVFVRGAQPGGPYEHAQNVIMGPEYFTRHQKELRKAGFDGMVIDEVHKGTKNESNKFYKAIEAWNDDLKLLLPLSGTPITTSPADILSLIKLLSKKEVWGDLSRKGFEDEFLEPSDVMAAAGVQGKAAPKTQVKASRREELAAILAKWVHVVMSKDVRGKILPAVRVGENQFTEMVGVQASLYALHMASLGPAERAQLSANSTLAADEMRGLGAAARKRVSAAKQVMDNPAIKPASGESMIHISVTGADGSTSRRPFRVFPGTGTGLSAMDWLKKNSGNRWPAADELTEGERQTYTNYFRQILGAQRGGKIADITYEEVAGTEINPYQWKAMKEAGWDRFGGQQVVNPDAGPLGVHFRGISVPKVLTTAEATALDQALAFQNAYAAKLESDTTLDHVQGLVDTAAEFGVSTVEAAQFMRAHPNPTTWEPSYTYGGVTVTTADQWVSDKTNSLHVPYRYEDWDFTRNRPKAGSPFSASTKDLTMVGVEGSYKFLKAPKPPNPPAELELEKPQIKEWKEQWTAEWQPGPFRYEERWGEDKGRIAVRDLGTGDLEWVDKKDAAEQVKSIFDPGMRKERAKYDLAMVAGNAKATMLLDLINNFYQHTDDKGVGHGHERGRSMITFAHSILGGARMAEAVFRVAGFRDANEAIPGSPHYDPEESGPAPNGKYFTTYIGATFTGDRNLNVQISKKKKDKLNRDTNTSLFVDKSMHGKKWRVYPGAKPHPLVQMSQWTYEERDRIHQQFKSINAPEAHIKDPETGQWKYFYGSDKKQTFDGIRVTKTRVVREGGKLVKDPVTGLTMREQVVDAKGNPVTEPLVVHGSMEILRQMTLIGNPTTMGAAASKKAKAELAILQAAYIKMASAGATTTAPMDSTQINVFNNTDLLALSDAGREGINAGHAVESVMIDSLASPMAEMQRMTRSARMMPPAVPPAMLNKYISAIRGHQGKKMKFQRLSSDPDHPRYQSGATLVRFANGAWSPVTAGKHEPTDLIAWRKDGMIAVEYETKEKGKVEVWVKPRDLSLNDGPFARIRDNMELDAFKPGRTSGPEGRAHDLRIGGSTPASVGFKEALERVALHAEEQADVPGIRSAAKAQWESIAARSRVGVTLGTQEAKTVLESLKTTRTPGQKATIIGYSKLTSADPLLGTYALHTAAERSRDVVAELETQGASPSDYHLRMQEAVNEPINAIREIIDNVLSVQERELIEEAGFTKMGETGVIDATEIYFSLRTAEIFDQIDKRRAVVAGEMRQSAAGKVVTDNDVMRRIIDELAPVDRAILKAKKALVNVTRLGVSAWMPRVATTPDPTDDTKTVTVHTGYDKQHPVALEQNTRVVGRARTRPVENLYHEIQRDVEVRTPVDHSIIDHKAIRNMRKTETTKKALRFVMDLNK